MAKVLTLVFVLLAVVVCSVRDSRAQTTAFTYQGSLKNGGSPASGNFDFQFKLFDMIAGGAQQGSTLQLQNVSVTNGVFTVSLDFGAGTLPGADRFLDIAVRTSGGGNFTPLAPRVSLSSAPYSVRSLNAATADSLSSSGSGNFIQNSTSKQTASFNISGDGTAGGMLAGNIIRAGTEFQIGEARVLEANIATANTFVGVGAGVSNTTGDQNTFVGRGTGPGNLTGNFNTFVGAAAGNGNLGSNNTAVGRFSGLSITTGSNNTLIGANSNVSSPTLSYAAAIGSDAVVGTDNTIVIGRSGGQDAVTIPGNVGIGTQSPVGKFHVSVPGSGNPISALTVDVGTFGTSGNAVNSYYFKVRDLGLGSPAFLIRGDGNVGIATDTPTERLDVVGNIKFSGNIIGNALGLTNVINRRKIALMKWYDINTTAVLTVPGSPSSGIVFDGESMRLGQVKVNVSDGTLTGGSGSASGCAYDGVNVWCTGIFSNQVSKLKGSDGGFIANYPVGNQPSTVVFDGTHVWIAGRGSNNVTRLRTDGACVGTCTFTVQNANGMAFDGTNIWIGNGLNNTVTKLRASDGFNLGTIPVHLPSAMAFDGSNMWVVDQGTGGQNGYAVKIRVSDNAVLGTYPVGDTPLGIAFDGESIWVTNWAADTVTRLRASDGACVGTCTIPVGDQPLGVAVDGAHIWVVNSGSATLSKF